MLNVSEAFNHVPQDMKPLRYHLFLEPTLCFLFIVLVSCAALHDLCPSTPDILSSDHDACERLFSHYRDTAADLSNGMSKDAIIEDLRRRLEESELSSNACSSSSGGRRRRRSRKPKSSLAPNLAATAAPALPLLSITAAKTAKKTKTKEAKPVKLVVGLNLNLELELNARIEGDITLSLV